MIKTGRFDNERVKTKIFNDLSSEYSRNNNDDGSSNRKLKSSDMGNLNDVNGIINNINLFDKNFDANFDILLNSIEKLND